MNAIGQIKERNKKQILRLLYTKELYSKKRLAKRLGLSPAVLTKLCNELALENRIVQESTLENRAVGRKEVIVEINPTYGYILGVIMNHKWTIFTLTDYKMNVIEQCQVRTKSVGIEQVKQMADRCQEIMDLVEKERVIGIGISIKGITDGESTFSGIYDEPVGISTFLESNLGIPVIMDNGVRCSAMLYQLCSEKEDYALIKYREPGIGAAIVQGGRIQRGCNYGVTDFGHMIMNPEREQCPVCKRSGCLESLISMEVLRDKYGWDAQKSVMEYMKENDLRVVLRYFATALINMVVINDVRDLVIYGDLFVDTFVKSLLEEEIKKMDPSFRTEKISYIVGEHEELAPIALVLHEMELL